MGMIPQGSTKNHDQRPPSSYPKKTAWGCSLRSISFTIHRPSFAVFVTIKQENCSQQAGGVVVGSAGVKSAVMRV